MAVIVEHTIFVSHLTDQMWFDGYRSSHKHINKMTEERINKRYYKKNGKPRKNHPLYHFMPVTQTK